MNNLKLEMNKQLSDLTNEYLNKTSEMSTASTVMLVVLLLILFIGILVGFPLAVIWGINTLFATSIPYTFWTWLSVVLLGKFVRSRNK